VVDAHISIQTTQSSFCLFVSTHSGELSRFGYTSSTSIQTSLTDFLILFKTLLFIEKIFATASSFLADIQIGFFTQSSISTLKDSGITLIISLFGKSTPPRAISRTLSTSS
jgi:hypothetical protein